MGTPFTGTYRPRLGLRVNLREIGKGMVYRVRLRTDLEKVGVQG